MARAPQRSKGGPGFLGMIIFIALSVALAGACVFLFLGYSKRGASLTKLQGEIMRDLESPLRDKGLAVSATPVASPAEVAYDDNFFNKVQQSALDGIKYDAFAKISGYTNWDEIKSELQKAPQPEPENLHAYVTRLTQEKGSLDRQLAERNQALQLATAQTKTAQDLQAQQSLALKATLDKSAAQLQEARTGYEKDLAGIKQLMAKADEDAKKAWAENRAQADAHKKESADLQAQIAKLDQTVHDLNDELIRKQPKAVAVTEGLILQADPLEGVAIINMGKNEQIQNGEKFAVMRAGKGGERFPKGELQVVRVDELVSRAEILNWDQAVRDLGLKADTPKPDDPIMRDDIVQREKKTE